MDLSSEMCKNLIKWLHSLTSERSKSIAEISDGVAMYNVLIQISPEHFNKLISKIKLDVGSNWRLKVSNLKKINESIIEYYQDVLNLQVLEAGRPDVVKLGETNDIIQIGKMLRLILGCAVNCDRKQEYITQIMALEESLQQCIMMAIQQLEEITGGPGRSIPYCLLSMDTDSRVARLVNELESANEAKEILNQRISKLERQINALSEEKASLIAENHNLLAQIEENQMAGPIRPPDTRKQMELLKEELFKVETIRDDYAAKIVDQDKQIHSLQEEIAKLQLAVEDSNRLKDEVDALSETANKVQEMETTLTSYKKKLEGYTDLKKQCKVLEDKNYEYIQQNLKYEEEMKKQNVWKGQSDMYKNKVIELEQKLDEQIEKLDKVTHINKNLDSKFASVVSEKDRLMKERDILREEIEEIKLGHIKPEKLAAMSQELVPTELEQRLKFLEKENATLRPSSQEALAKQALLDDALTRVKKLTESNRASNQRILELESQLEDQKPEKIVQLQEALAAKEAEVQTLQAKYARSVEKAKEVAAFLDMKTNGSLEPLGMGGIKPMEEKLIASAFYKLSSVCQREAVDERVALLSGVQGQSFLSRQRQPMPRKATNPFKSK
ncbi:protein hook [Onthophagus taurus]|uniref:protein hook n=1 Tax=Onthophagus taurus TaxID=166361 RepID=UPI000C20DE25|nr:protein hook [Onthophagus taurus]